MKHLILHHLTHTFFETISLFEITHKISNLPINIVHKKKLSGTIKRITINFYNHQIIRSQEEKTLLNLIAAVILTYILSLCYLITKNPN